MTVTPLSQVFADVLDAPPEARPALLEAVRRQHPDWIATLEQLLAAEARLPATSAVTGALLDDPVALRPGARIGSYVIQREIGRGGMGVVYLARDASLQRDVALKAVRPDVAPGPRELDTLREEARVLARLSETPGIAQVHAFIEHEGRGFIVQELVRGQTLRERIARGPTNAPEALAITAAVVDALAAAHHAGIVHRDLKPENVMCTPEGQVKVLDFGIALRHELPMTRARGVARPVVGTLGYMAPEQLLGQPVDGRTDLFAVGVLLYELLTARHPFGGSDDERWSGILVQPPATLTAVEQGRIPADAMQIVERCLRKVSTERWSDAGELAGALAAASAAKRTSSAPAATPPAHLAPSGSPAIRWWQFHHVSAAVITWLLLVPTWHVRQWISVVDWRLMFAVLLATLAVVPSLRLSVSFVAAMHPKRARAHLARVGGVIRAGELLYALGLVVIGVDLLREHAGWATLFIAFGVGLAAVGRFVEPLTEQAALEAIDGTSTTG